MQDNIGIPDAEYDEVDRQFSSPRVNFFDVGKVLCRHNLYYQVVCYCMRLFPCRFNARQASA